MIIERLSREHRNIEMLLAVLERELEIFDSGGRPDYEVIRAIISYFELYPEVYHHPQEDLVFAKLKIRDPAAAAKVGDLALEHQKGAERLRRLRITDIDRRQCSNDASDQTAEPSASRHLDHRW